MILIISFSAAETGDAAVGPREPRQIVSGTSWSPSVSPAISPRQHHAPRKAWVLALEMRPEIRFWIDRWSSPEGIEQLAEAREYARPFRRLVTELISEASLPPELVALPIVESNWRFNAVSPAGAVGPWQFLYSSARGRDLIIDAWRDERRDPWRSTEAAMEELTFNYRVHQDWLLAIASYNAGANRILRLRKKTGLNDFWSLREGGFLPRETSAYVPQFLAVAYLEATAGRHGLPITWDSPPEWVRIPVNKALRLDDLASAADVSPELIRLAHAELQQSVTPPSDIPYAVKVPLDTLEAVTDWLEEQESDAPHTGSGGDS